MILIDTNVLVALVDERDRLRSRAMSDLTKLKGPFGILDAVLVETFFLLGQPYLRRRVRFVLERLTVLHMQIQTEWWSTIFDWLEKYARHEPDLCDAALVVAATHEKRSIWTYDTEFAKLWRTPEGRPLQLVGSIAKTRRRKPTGAER
jgi:predicted nucleic acid-binding protein